MTKTRLLAAALPVLVACATTVPDPSLEQDGEGGAGSDSVETGGKAPSTGGANTGGSSATGGSSTGGTQGPSTGGAPAEGGAGPGGTGQDPTGTGGVTATGTPRDEALYGKLTLKYTPSGTTQFSLDLTNTTGQDLKLAGLEIRYWFTPEGAITDAVVECYSVQGAITSCSDLTRTLVDGAQPYLSIVVNVPDTHTFWATTGEPDKIEGLQISIHRQDYQGDDMTNDYSYQATEGANSKVTVYYNGLLVLGEEPPL
jgi:hypothetical protein